MFRNEDIENITENIDNIKNNAIMKFKDSYDPTIHENIEVYKIIQNYIKEKKRIIYGGFAQHLLIKHKNKTDGIYTELNGVCFNYPEIADMEFYSFEPLNDIVDLTNLLFNLKFKYIEARGAIHPRSYKIYVNTLNYCDFTYMPKNIYDNMPIINIDGFICCHPYFMLIDAYKILNDPLTSYWRLEKPIYRFQKILKYYPISKLEKKILIEVKPNINNVLKYIRKHFIYKKNVIVIGLYAYNYYIKKIHKKDMININNYDIISIKFDKDYRKIYKKLKNKFKNIRMVEYYPFYEYIGKSIEYYYNNILVLRVIDKYDRCTVYNYSEKKKTFFGTNNLVFMHLLFRYYYYYINKNKYFTDLYLELIQKFYHSKIDFLNKKQITVLDKSPFQDFTLHCLGKHIDLIRKSFIDGKQNLQNKKAFKFKHLPTGNNKNISWKYPDITGNIKNK